MMFFKYLRMFMLMIPLLGYTDLYDKCEERILMDERKPISTCTAAAINYEVDSID